MSIYLVAAYVIFCAAPLGLGLSLLLRRRKVEHALQKRALQQRVLLKRASED